MGWMMRRVGGERGRAWVRFAVSLYTLTSVAKLVGEKTDVNETQLVGKKNT